MRRHICLAIIASAALMVANNAAGGPAKQASHTHLAVTLSIKPGKPGVAGDIIGVYSFEIIPCETTQPSHGVVKLMQTVADALGSVIIPPAFANHRDRFDRIGAMQSLIRVPVSQPGNFNLGEVDVTQQYYCHVRLTFARLPVVAGAKPMAALETSIFMNRPAGLKPLALPYSVPFDLPIVQPWRPSAKGDGLRITIDPSVAYGVLRDAPSEDGTLGQRVVTLWRNSARLSFTIKP